MINWDALKEEDGDVINDIAHRVKQGNPRVDRLNVEMDIVATHLSCPLRLKDLLAADDANFWHDIAGISRHLDRKTGQLKKGFLPRFAAPETKRVAA